LRQEPPGQIARGKVLSRGGAAAAQLYLTMEWHMKRLCHRCGVSASSLSPMASLTLRPEPDFKWVLLWRDNQRHRPPSKR